MHSHQGRAWSPREACRAAGLEWGLHSTMQSSPSFPWVWTQATEENTRPSKAGFLFTLTLLSSCLLKKLLRKLFALICTSWKPTECCSCFILSSQDFSKPCQAVTSSWHFSLIFWADGCWPTIIVFPLSRTRWTCCLWAFTSACSSWEWDERENRNKGRKYEDKWILCAANSKQNWQLVAVSRVQQVDTRTVLFLPHLQPWSLVPAPLT